MEKHIWIRKGDLSYEMEFEGMRFPLTTVSDPLKARNMLPEEGKAYLVKPSSRINGVNHAWAFGHLFYDACFLERCLVITDPLTYDDMGKEGYSEIDKLHSFEMRGEGTL